MLNVYLLLLPFMQVINPLFCLPLRLMEEKRKKDNLPSLLNGSIEEEVMDLLKSNGFENLNGDYYKNKIQVNKFDYYNDYEEIADEVISILKIIQ